MFRKILVPIDLSHKSLAKKALSHAAGLKDADGRISAFHVSIEFPAHVASQMPSDIIEETRASERRELKKLIEDSGYDVDTEVRSGPVAKTLLAKAEEMDADLIIIGSHDPSLQDYLIGSTAASTVRHAKCPVLVIR